MVTRLHIGISTKGGLRLMVVAVLLWQGHVIKLLYDNLVKQTFVHAALASQLQITQIAFGEFQRELCHRRL